MASIHEDGFSRLSDMILQAQKQLDLLSQFDGAQNTRAIAKLQELIDGILTQVNGVFSGYVQAGTTIHSGGRGTFDGGVTSADVKSRTLSVSYDAVYIDVNNIMGKSPSARRFKQDIESYRFDPAVIDELDGVRFRLLGAVEALGDAAKVEHGFIAEQLEEIGLDAFVSYDAEGIATGIAYERLTVPLVSVVQDLRARVASLEERS